MKDAWVRFVRVAFLSLVLAGLAGPGGGVPAAAQVHVGTDVAFKTRHVWRGLTYRNASVLQPDVFVTVGKPTSLLSAGVWTSIELTDVAPRKGIGYGRHFFGELDVWAEYARAWERVAGAVGWTSYFFDVGRAVNLPGGLLRDTHEVYGRLEVYPLTRLDLSLAGWYDVEAVRGAYVEATVRYRLSLWNKVVIPVGSLFLQAQAGYSRGQAVNERDATEVAYFDKDGLTHVDLSLAFTVGYNKLGPFNYAVHVEGHVPVNQDRRTRKTKGWVGLTLTLLAPRCRPERSICP